MRQPALPVGGYKPPLDGELVDIVRQRQRGHVGVDPVDDRAGLLARPSVRLVDGDRVPCLLLPIFCEGLVVFDVQLPRGIVADVEDRDVFCKQAADCKCGCA